MRCATCDEEAKYDVIYDALYCDRCNVWLEAACEGGECEACMGRPERPDPSRGAVDGRGLSTSYGKGSR